MNNIKYDNFIGVEPCPKCGCKDVVLDEKEDIVYCQSNQCGNRWEIGWYTTSEITLEVEE